MNWRKHRKMALQLLSVSCLSLIVAFPQSLIVVVRQVGGPRMVDFAIELSACLAYLSGVVVLLLPFVCLGGLSELWPKIWFLNWKRRTAVRPLGMMETVEHGTFAKSRFV